MKKKKFLALAVATAIAGTTMLGVTSAYTVTYHPEANVSYTLNSGFDTKRDFTAGLITITNGTETYTIMDRNLGATSTGIDSSDSYGYYFQWGNNYGFPSDPNASITTSSTQVDASGYGPGNYYSGSTFITRSSSPWDRSSVQNDNLRGGEDGTNEAMQGPCPEGYHVPSSEEWLGLSTMLGYDGDSISNASIQAINSLRNELYLPFAGGRYNSSAGVSGQGTYAGYWSSTAYSADYAYYLIFNSAGLYPQHGGNRSNGLSVRCFKNSPYSTSDLPSEQQPTVAQINLSVIKGTLTIGTEISNLNLGEVNVSNSAQELSGSFGADSFWVEDMKGVESGFYTTISVTDLTGSVATHVISANNVYLKTAGSTPSNISGATASEAKVVFGNAITSWHNGSGQVNYFQRLNTSTAEAGRVGKWGDNLQVKVNIPAHTPFDTYRGTITYTLYDNDL